METVLSYGMKYSVQVPIADVKIAQLCERVMKTSHPLKASVSPNTWHLPLYDYSGYLWRIIIIPTKISLLYIGKKYVDLLS